MPEGLVTRSERTSVRAFLLGLVAASLASFAVVGGACALDWYDDAIAMDVMGCRVIAEAKCPDMDLHGADMRHASLTDAVLAHSNLQGAQLMRADLRRADLRGADLRNTRLDGADLRDARLEGASFPAQACTARLCPG